MRLPNWFSKKPSPTSSAASSTHNAAPVLASAAIADSIAEAERSLAAALERVDSARATLAQQRTEESLQAVRGAKLAADDVDEMLTVLRTDHAAALASEAAAARAELERRCADLGAQLTPEAIRDAIESDAQAEAEEILALALRRKRRLDHVARLRAAHHQHRVLLMKLGQVEDVGATDGNVHLASSPAPVVEHLGPLVRASQQDGETLRALITPLLPTYTIYPRTNLAAPPPAFRE